MVNEQLGQLYMDMQLEGTGDRLHLEEGSSASSSSEDENTPEKPKVKKVRQIKIHEYATHFSIQLQALFSPNIETLYDIYCVSVWIFGNELEL